MRTRLLPLVMSAAAFLVAGLFYTTSPALSQSGPRPANCEQTNTGERCEEDEECMSILVYERCTTEIYRLPENEEGSSGTELPQNFDEPGEPEGPACTWGDDYIGWEPGTC